ncbi:MAG: hypothetical protein QY330_03040 [Candidatus Dojkabacteria bacterium]|nr:MAG: hypothetical protein QY330_03040 [Candidatus Dojkabacteria bacterium]
MKKPLLLRLFVFLSVIGTITVNVLANALPIAGRTTAEVSDYFRVFFVPAGYVFAIWGLIYLALISYSVFQLRKSTYKNELYNKIAPFVIVGSIANAVWVLLWHNLQIELTLIAMLTLLMSLIAIYLLIDKHSKKDNSLAYNLFVKGTFSLYLGWISVATIANVTNILFLQLYMLPGTMAEIIPSLSSERLLFGLANELWAAIMIVIAGLLASLFILRHKDYVFASVITWALFGIYMKFQETNQIAFSVVLAFIIMLLAILLPRKALLKKTK